MCKNLSYKPLAECCGKKNVDCEYLGTKDQPCWGKVAMDAIDTGDEGLIPIHACQGHYGIGEGEPYKPEVLP